MEYYDSWSTDPVLDEGGNHTIATFNRRDAEDSDVLKFRALNRHRYLCADDLAALIEGKVKPVRDRLKILKAEPNWYVQLAYHLRQTKNRKKYQNSRRFYENAPRAETILKELGFTVHPRAHPKDFEHQIMTDRIMVSFELGAREPDGCRIITWPELLAHPDFPEKTRREKHPAALTCKFDFQWNTERHSLRGEVRADGFPFVLVNPHETFFCPGIEADCGTEPVEPENLSRSSILRKFAFYIHVIEQRLYEHHFGADTFYVPFYTLTNVRKHSMMALLHRMTEHKPSLRKHFTFDVFDTFSTFPAPSSWAFTEPAERVGYPPLNFTGR